jgi:hypothetical protein
MVLIDNITDAELISLTTPEWDRIKSAYGLCSDGKSRLMSTNLCRSSLDLLPSFGWYPEHTSRFTLRDFFGLHSLDMT